MRWSINAPCFALVATVLLSAACGGGDDADEQACTADARFGLNVTVVNSVSRQRLCDATVTVRDGDYQETLQPFPAGSSADCQFIGAPERAGTYQITASRSGYAAASAITVSVKADRCHVTPESVTIELEALKR